MLAGRDVALYAEDGAERVVLAPIGIELERRGARVRFTGDFSERADVGLYACHPNRFFDFQDGHWQKPPNALSILALHDLGQSNGLDTSYFSEESWHVFDLGLLPGAEWQGMWERAIATGVSGPTLGMHVVGWPKMDHVHRDPAGFARAVREVRDRLGIGVKPALLLACSWSDRRQLEDALEVIDLNDYQLVVKYPDSSPPPAGSPWEHRLSAAYAERQLAAQLARATPGVVVADDDADIMLLIAASDVVLSNGSNVLYEGVMSGVPGISVRDWVHPAGPDGEATVQSRMQLPGVLAGDLASVPTMLRIVRDPLWTPFVRQGADALVEPSTRGRGAVLSADAIEGGLRWSDDLTEEQRAELARDVQAATGNPMLAMLRQLREYERHVSELNELLRQLNERDQAARVELQQLAKQHRQVTEEHRRTTEELERITAQERQVHQRLIYAEQTLETIRTSRSWRLTEPLRAAARRRR